MKLSFVAFVSFMTIYYFYKQLVNFHNFVFENSMFIVCT